MKVEILLSTVLAISTVFYTIINLMMWFESKATRNQKITPLVIAYLQMSETHNIMILCIKNIGEGLAKNVRISIKDDYNIFDKSDLLLSQRSMIKNGINNLPPQLEVSCYINHMKNLNLDDNHSRIELDIFYENINKKALVDSYDLPFNQTFRENYSKPPDTYMGQIPYYLSEINKSLNKK